MDFIIHGENSVSLNGFYVVIRPLLLSFQTKVFHGDPAIALGDGGKLKCEDRQFLAHFSIGGARLRANIFSDGLWHFDNVMASASRSFGRPT